MADSKNTCQTYKYHEESYILTKNTTAYFAKQFALNEIESNKQLLEGITNLYFAMQGQRMNEIMKMLTIVSSIFIPLTFIAGIYGMNFTYIPELNSKYGYFFTLILMSLISIILILYFRKKGWFK